MRTEIPKMTYEERQARAQVKKDIILGFLASGEVYTSVVVAAQVMASSPSAAERTLIGLVRNGALKFESHMVSSRKTYIYGISVTCCVYTAIQCNITRCLTRWTL